MVQLNSATYSNVDRLSQGRIVGSIVALRVDVHRIASVLEQNLHRGDVGPCSRSDEERVSNA
jgi:hypothetical protein